MQNIFGVLCFVLGAAVSWFWLRAKMAAAAERLALREQECGKLETSEREKEIRIQELGAANASLQAHLEEAVKAARFLEQARDALADAFKALSADALQRNNQAFLELARATLENTRQAAAGDLELRQQAIAAMVQPVRESLDKFQARVQEIESARTGAYATLTEQVKSLLETQTQLRTETGRLVTALRAPGVRGRWGEMQLRRVVEMAGMLDHCDFWAQQSVCTEEGRLRPDLLVRLPGGKTIVVDSKAPLEAYLNAVEASDEETRRARLAAHAAQIRAHVTGLARRGYWEQFQPAPEFVVLFLPGESFFSAALEQDPSLIEFGVDQRIILATPTTLIALLRAVAYGWKQQDLARNAAEIAALGKELYKRLADMGQHWAKVGKGLERAVEAYNGAVGSLESRVMVTARKFAELNVAANGLDELAPVDRTVRSLQASELSEPERGAAARAL